MFHIVRKDRGARQGGRAGERHRHHRLGYARIALRGHGSRGERGVYWRLRRGFDQR
jgi:hypothetical protein